MKTEMFNEWENFGGKGQKGEYSRASIGNCST